jgi:hypothetical protein
MLKLPLSIIYAMIAFNITAFTVLLQMDVLIFHSIIVKIIAWALTIGTWAMVYINRKKFITLF